MIFFRILLFFLPIFATASLNQKGDLQFWVQQKQKVSISESSFLFFDVEARWGDDVSYLYYIHAEAMLVHKMSPLFSFAWGYRQVFSRSSASFKPTYEPLADVLFKKEGNLLVFSHRSRFSYLVRQDNPDAFQYRSLFSLLFKARISPYVSEEAFFRDKRGFVQNRISLGLNTDLASFFNMKVFYTFRQLKSSKDVWRYQNVIGAYATLSF